MIANAHLPPPVIGAEERHRMIATAAYYLAEQRNFAPGAEQRDWMLAERQIDLMLATMRRAGHSRQDLERVGLRNALHLWSVPDTVPPDTVPEAQDG